MLVHCIMNYLFGNELPVHLKAYCLPLSSETYWCDDNIPVHFHLTLCELDAWAVEEHLAPLLGGGGV